MSALVMFSTFGALERDRVDRAAGVLRHGARWAAFQWLASVHPRYGTPHRAIIAPGHLVVRPGRDRHLPPALHPCDLHRVDLLRAHGPRHLILRRRPDYTPDYRCGDIPSRRLSSPRRPLSIVANQIVSDPTESAIGLLLVLAGLPVYALWVCAGARRGDLVDDHYRLSQSLLSARLSRCRPQGTQQRARHRRRGRQSRCSTIPATTTSWYAGTATSRTARPSSTSTAWTSR